MLRTSINMNIAVFVKIGLAATRLGKSRREIVIMLLSRIRHDFHLFQGGFRLVRYQPRDSSKQWHCFTIRFKKHENELVTDFRKLGKYSVSYLVALAVDWYLDELLQDEGDRHNYVELKAYAIGIRIENGIICWELYWGDPPEDTRTTIHRRTASL